MPVIYSNGSSGGGSVSIPELYTDPVSPTPQSAWVLATDQGALGTPIGLLLSLTHAVSIFTYQLSYRTLEGTTIRSPLS
jgi:hypothetical protein